MTRTIRLTKAQRFALAFALRWVLVDMTVALGTVDGGYKPRRWTPTHTDAVRSYRRRVRELLRLFAPTGSDARRFLAQVGAAERSQQLAACRRSQVTRRGENARARRR